MLDSDVKRYEVNGLLNEWGNVQEVISMTSSKDMEELRETFGETYGVMKSVYLYYVGGENPVEGPKDDTGLTFAGEQEKRVMQSYWWPRCSAHETIMCGCAKK